MRRVLLPSSRVDGWVMVASYAREDCNLNVRIEHEVGAGDASTHHCPQGRSSIVHESDGWSGFGA